MLELDDVERADATPACGCVREHLVEPGEGHRASTSTWGGQPRHVIVVDLSGDGLQHGRGRPAHRVLHHLMPGRATGQARGERCDHGVASARGVAGQRRRQSGLPAGTLLGHQHQTVGTAGDQHVARTELAEGGCRRCEIPRAGRPDHLGTVRRDQIGAGPQGTSQCVAVSVDDDLRTVGVAEVHQLGVRVVRQPTREAAGEHHDGRLNLAHQRVESSHQGQPVRVRSVPGLAR